MGEWRTVRLRDICDSVDYGLTASASAEPVGPKFLRITDIVNGSLDWATVPFVEATTEQFRKYRLNSGDIVIARTGATTGHSKWINEPPNAIFASYLVRLKVSSEVNARFVGYLLKSDQFRNYVSGVLGDKSAQPNASATTLTEALLRIPVEKSEQYGIATVLGVLDDKMVVNERIAKTLDKLACEKFNFFLQELPEDVESTKLATLAEHLPGKYLARDDYANGGAFVVYGSNSVMGSHTRYLYDGPFTVMARIGSNCGAFTWSSKAAWVNNNASAIRAKPAADPWFLHRLLGKINMDRHRSGSGQPFIRVESLMDEHVIYISPDKQRQIGAILREFAEIADNMSMQNAILEQLRDTLLPKLMSGQLRVRDAEKIVEDAA